MLRRHADARVLVWSSAKVGHNLFSVDRREGASRYVDSLGRQGFYVSQRTQDPADTVHGFVAALPEADSTINRTWVRDGVRGETASSAQKTRNGRFSLIFGWQLDVKGRVPRDKANE